jgi:hypothetical protein
MNELFTNLIGANLLDANVVNKLNQILAELQKLGTDVKTLTDKFVKGNAKVTTTNIDPAILNVAKTFETDIQKNVTAAGGAAGQQPTTTSTPSPTTTAGLAGTYSGNGGTITINNDGTWSGSNAEFSLGGTYTVSGNTITFTSEQGKVDSGTIENGAILLSNGVRITK